MAYSPLGSADSYSGASFSAQVGGQQGSPRSISHAAFGSGRTCTWACACACCARARGCARAQHAPEHVHAPVHVHEQHRRRSAAARRSRSAAATAGRRPRPTGPHTCLPLPVPTSSLKALQPTTLCICCSRSWSPWRTLGSLRSSGCSGPLPATHGGYRAGVAWQVPHVDHGLAPGG
jgi:hypothetical protein